MATATHSRAYRLREKQRDASRLASLIVTLIKEIQALRADMDRHFPSRVTSPSLDSPLKNLPSEDEESLSLESIDKNLRILFPDSSLANSPRARANGSGFYGNIDAAAAAFGKKDASNK